MRWMFLAVLVSSCVASHGDLCTLDSDCEASLVCSFEGVCQNPDELKSSLQCTAPTGMFNASTTACEEPHEIVAVTHMQIVADKESNGLWKLASFANGVLKTGISTGDIAIYLAVDGSLDPACDASLAWIPSDDWRNDDCTPKYTDTFPLTLPGLGPEGSDATFLVYEAVFDRTANTLYGYVIPDEVRGVLAPSLQDAVSDAIFFIDYDSDGDKKPDKPSVLVAMALASPTTP